VTSAFVHHCACGRRALVASAPRDEAEAWLATCRQAAGGVQVVDADENGFVCAGCGRFSVRNRANVLDVVLDAPVPVTISLN
jgi:hypothetical protein